MNDRQPNVARHYAVDGLLDSIRSALVAAGRSLGGLTPADLAPVDEFHIRGREATLELAQRGGLGPGQRVLDVGCGLGGSARYLAAELGCQVDGIDLTEEYVRTAEQLAQWVGLQQKVRFHTGSALDLCFEEASFDAVWTEHAQMNIEDKAGFYRELRRVLKPGGRLVFHDIFQGEGGDVLYPVPWADDGSISCLWSAPVALELLASLAFRRVQWEDRTRVSADWFRAKLAELGQGERPPLGLHLLLGKSGPEKFVNMNRNLAEDRIAVFQGVLEKS